MSEATDKPEPLDPQLLAVITAALVAAIGHGGFRVISIEQAKAEGMG